MYLYIPIQICMCLCGFVKPLIKYACVYALTLEKNKKGRKRHFPARNARKFLGNIPRGSPLFFSFYYCSTEACEN